MEYRSESAKFAPQPGYGLLHTANQSIGMKNSARSYDNKQLLNEVEHDIENYQGRDLCYQNNTIRRQEHFLQSILVEHFLFNVCSMRQCFYNN